jgi:hypothetical protein
VAGDGSPAEPNAYFCSSWVISSAGSVCTIASPLRSMRSLAPGDSEMNDSPSKPLVRIEAIVSAGIST